MDEQAKAAVAQTLRGAAGYIRRYGWCKDRLFDRVANLDKGITFPSACALGAIILAATGEADRDIGLTSALATTAIRSFAEYLVPEAVVFDREDAEQTVWSLNDRPDMTGEAMCDLLDKAADYYTSETAVHQ
jgi:hypothetical protein